MLGFAIRGREMGPVLLLDDDQDLVESLEDLLRFFERPFVSAHSVDELKHLDGNVMGCSLAILDINLGKGQPSGIDAYHWLRDRKFSGRIVFLTGHGQSHPLVAEAHRLGGTQVLSKPLTVEELRGLLLS